MFLNIPLLTDILSLTCNRQALINYRLLKINHRHRRQEYKVNDYVFMNVPNRDTVQSGPVRERISC